MLTSTKTSLQGAKRKDITYVRAAPRRTPLQLSLLLNEGMVFRPASLDLTALDPSTSQKTIKQKTQQMQWRMIVSPDDDCWTGTTQSLSGGRKFLQKSTGVSLELALQILTPNLVESCQHPCPGQKLSISNWRKSWVVWQNIVIPLLHKRQWRSLLDLMYSTVNESSQFTNCVIPVVTCCLTIDKILGNWNRTHVIRDPKLTIIHTMPCRVDTCWKTEHGTNVKSY